MLIKWFHHKYVTVASQYISVSQPLYMLYLLTGLSYLMANLSNLKVSNGLRLLQIFQSLECASSPGHQALSLRYTIVDLRIGHSFWWNLAASTLSEETAHSTVYHHLNQQSSCITTAQRSLRWRYTMEWASISESVAVKERYVGFLDFPNVREHVLLIAINKEMHMVYDTLDIGFDQTGTSRCRSEGDFK